MPSDLRLPPPSAVGTTQSINTCQFFQRRPSVEQVPALMEPPIHHASSLPSPASLPSPRTLDIFDRPFTRHQTSPRPFESIRQLPPQLPPPLKPLEVPFEGSEPSYSRRGSYQADMFSPRDLRRSSLPFASFSQRRERSPPIDRRRASPPHLKFPHSSPPQSHQTQPHCHLASPPTRGGNLSRVPSPTLSYPSPPTSIEDAQQGEQRASKAPSRGWKPEEDKRLIAAMRIHNGSNYKAIAEMVGNGRTPKQCRERYHENLAEHLSHEKATDGEVERIVYLVEHYGKKWSKIAQILGNRAPNTVKNFYNSRRKPLRNQKSQARQAQRHSPPPLSLPPFSDQPQRPLPHFGQRSMHVPAHGQPQPLYAGY